MKLYFFGIQDREKKYASKSFISELRKFLNTYFEGSLYPLFDKKILVSQCRNIPIEVGSENAVVWDEVDMLLDPIGQLFTFQLAYKHKEGRFIQPFDTVEKGSLEFQISNFPSNDELLVIQDSWSEVIQDFTQSRLIDRKFRFLFREKRGCMPPDITLRITTPAEGAVVENLLGEGMKEWNERIRDVDDTIRDSSEGGLIHNLSLEKVNRDEKIIVVDLGSGFKEALLFLLKKLDDSELTINKVVLE